MRMNGEETRRRCFGVRGDRNEHTPEAENSAMLIELASPSRVFTNIENRFWTKHETSTQEGTRFV